MNLISVIIAKISNLVKAHFNDIILFIIIALLILFSFACGFIMAKYQQKQPISITYEKHTATYSFVS